MKKLIGFDQWTDKIDEKDCGCNEKIIEKTTVSPSPQNDNVNTISGLKKSIQKLGYKKTIDLIRNTEDEDQIIEKSVSTDMSKEMTEKGLSLPDGSFPIGNVSDLKKAIKSYGRSKNKSDVAKHIVKRAKELGKSDLIPHTEDFQKSLKA
jgi:hypothetical protein